MELLDDNIKLTPDGLSVRKLEEKIAIKKEYSEAQKHFNNARITAGIITFLTIITMLFVASSNGDVGLVEIGLLSIYLAAIFVPIEYSKYSLSIISILYAANLALAFTAFTNGLLLFVILVRLGILYFIAKGAYSGFKFDTIIKKMKSLDMQILQD